MRTIPYELKYARRKTLGIRVLPDASVRVTAPQGASLEAIQEVLLRKAAWIVRKQAEVLAHVPRVPPLHYVSGETHLYLGLPLTLQVQWGAKGAVALDGRQLRVQTPDPASARAVAALLDGWYRRQAQVVFAEELAGAGRRVQALGITLPAAIRIRKMKGRWGSCTGKGDITLNLRLIQAERPLIEYVLVHELCHLLQHNHSAAYYQLLDRAIPDWRERKQRLNAAPIA